MRGRIDDERISVVIPVYNRGKRIGKCLDSIINQIHKVYEIIVIDDCSTDATADIVRQYQEKYVDSNIIYDKLEKNSGAQVARNRGIELARGKWICFCDSDDEWLKNKIEMQFDVLKNNDFNEYIVIHGNCEVNDTVKYKRYVWQLPIVQGTDCYSALLRCPGPMFQAILTSRRALIEVGKLGEDIKSYQEWDTSLRLATKCEFIHIEEPLFIYNLHNGGQISDDVEKDFDGYEYIIDRYKEDILSICGVETWNRHILKLIKKAIEKRRDFIEHYVNKLIFRKLVAGKKYILFGCGQFGNCIEEILRIIGGEVVAYVDNNKKIFNNSIVYSLDEIRKTNNEVFFITTKKYQSDIAKQLDDAGYKQGIDYIKFTDVFE